MRGTYLPDDATFDSSDYVENQNVRTPATELCCSVGALWRGCRVRGRLVDGGGVHLHPFLRVVVSSRLPLPSIHTIIADDPVHGTSQLWQHVLFGLATAVRLSHSPGPVVHPVTTGN